MKVALTVNDDRNLLMVQLFNKMVKEEVDTEGEVYYFQHDCNKNNEVGIVGEDIENKLFGFRPYTEEEVEIKNYTFNQEKYEYESDEGKIFCWKATKKWDLVVVTKTDMFHLDFLRFMCADTNTKLVALDDEMGWVNLDEEQHELRKEIVKNFGF